MEKLDLYDREGRRKGITVFRGEYIRPDDYILVVHIYLYNANQEFLIQRRSRKKRINSGRWDITGGAVQAGEESKEAALRETFEEIGIRLDPDRLRFAGRVVSVKHLVDIYFCPSDIDLDRCALQEEEVSEVKLVPKQKLLELLKMQDLSAPPYLRILERELKEMEGAGGDAP
ncbi:hypothetical protein ABB02_00072 [Clostridiaceae bacterium JG1575]|nr:hypothetical protein ABB02_00072 [Clostridiaceae bacterium JG1575]